jgi:putrescine aminotransferase
VVNSIARQTVRTPTATSYVGHQLLHEPLWASQPLPLIERAEGCFFFTADGRRIIDGNSSLQNVLIGHGRKEMAELAARQIAQLDFAPLFNASHPLVEELASRLHSLLPHLERFYFMNSGSEAVETALKLVREYWLLRGEPQRSVIISREGSYHGNTLGALAATGIATRREPFLPLLAETARLSRPGANRGEDDETASARLAQELEEVIERCGPERVLAVIGEPLQLKGLTIPPEGYWRRVRAICDAYAVPLVVDEIITGFGRTGRWFGMNHWGVQGDIVTLAKGLCSGYAPISSVGISAELASVFDSEPNGVFHQLATTAGHPLACALTLENLNTIEREGLVERAEKNGGTLLRLTQAAFASRPYVAEIGGIGMLCSVRFKTGAVPVGPDADSRLTRGCIEHGAYLRADGDLLFAPPLTVDEATLEELVAIGLTATDEWGRAG